MATEFVIRRRRKRLQMDFESDPQDLVTSAGPPQPTVDVEVICQSPTMNMVPDIAVLPESTSPTPDVQSDQADLTVEGFLCRSARKTYLNQKSGRATIHTDKKTSGSIRTTYKAKRGRRLKTPAKAKVAVRGTKIRRRTRLAEALSRAVILTHGDPSEAIQDPNSLRRNCRPLTFVTVNKFDSLQRRATEDDDTIADSLDSRNEDVSQTTTWREPRNIGVRPCKPRAHRSGRSEGPRSGHLPLVLVPVREAEAAYSALFS
ncbi:hypothetical protein EDD16DRAFT_1559825 [Pisolithus croceorrhizus]|nr:hypothetical protein EDD16DRAFT_1559825 [Pisolithus croceorrhizus]